LEFSLPGCIPAGQHALDESSVSSPKNYDTDNADGADTPDSPISPTLSATFTQDFSILELHDGGNPAPHLGPSELPILSRSPSRQISLSSQSSTRQWNCPHETFIIFDWDDTLCPTSSCLSRSSAAGLIIDEGTDSEAIAAHQRAVVDLLRLAAGLAGVVIVTMATTDWVRQCISHMMPDVAVVLKEFQIDVICARTTTRQRLREAMSEGREPSHYLKRKAMSRVIKTFYRDEQFLRRVVGLCRSWKNIVSIGDSQDERFALQDVVFQHTQRDKNGRWKECRCKTVLVKEAPRLEQLTEQHRRLAELLPKVVHYDGDIDLDLDGGDTSPFFEALVYVRVCCFEALPFRCPDR
jgi:hypothetical protein